MSGPPSPPGPGSNSDDDGPLTRPRLAIAVGVAVIVLLAATGALPVQFGSETDGDAGAGLDIVGVDIDNETLEGEQVVVDVTIENPTNETLTDTLAVELGDLGEELVTLALPAGETDTTTVAFETTDGDAGEYTATVTTSTDGVDTSTEVLTAESTFEIAGADAPAEATAGDNLTVEYLVENTGGVSDTQTVVFSVDGTALGGRQHTLDSGDTANGTFTYEVNETAGTTLTVDVATEDDSESATVVVAGDAGEPFFEVASVDAPQQVTAGEEFTVSVEVTNEGGEQDSGTLTVGAEFGERSTEFTTLSSGESTTETFTFLAENAGEYTITADTGDAEATTTVTVEEATSASVSQPDIADEGSEATVPEGEGGTIAVDVTNDGDASSQFEASLSIDGTPETTSTVSLSPGETGTVEFEIPADLETGTYDITISVAGETATGTLEVTQQAASALSGLDIAGQGDDATVTLPSNQGIAVTVENVGGVSDSFTVDLAVGDTTEQTVTNELGGGETETVTFEGILGGLEPGAYDVAVSTDNDEVAGAVTVQQPEGAVFQVQSTEAQPGTIESGDTVTLSATIENTGSMNDTRTVGLDVLTAAGITREKTLTLGSGESDTVAFDVQIEETGQHQYFFDTDDDENGGSVTVESQEPFFVVTSVSTNAPITENETLEVTVELSNTGDEPGIKTLTVDGGGLGSNSTDVSIPGGGSITETLTLDTEQGDSGTYSLAVGTEDGAETTSVTVDASEDDGGDGGDTESANFEVETQDVSASLGPSSGAVTPAQDGTTVVAGQKISVVVEVTNTGSVEGTQEVELLVDAGGKDPLGTDVTEMTLASGESDLRLLNVNTDPTDEPGAYTAQVSSENDTASEPIQLEKPSGSANFEVEINDVGAGPSSGAVTPAQDGATVVAGQGITVVVEVTNTGSVEGTQTIDLLVDAPDQGPLGTDDVTVSLDSGESKLKGLTVSTDPTDEPGAYTAQVSSENDTASASIQLEKPSGEFSVSIPGTNSPVAGEDLEVTVDVTNTGDVTASPTVQLTTGVGDTSADISSLEPGATASKTLSVSTAEGDIGTIDVTATVGDATANTTVEVEALVTEFLVDITGINNPVAGEDLEVDVNVTNNGTQSGIPSIELTTTPDIGTAEDSINSPIEPGESLDATLSVSTQQGDAGTQYTAIVDSGDNQDSKTFEVLEEAFFDVSITEIPEEVEVGEQLEVTAEVNNTGDAAANQTISLLVDGIPADSTTVEDLSGTDDPAEVTLTVDTSGADPGTELSVQVTSSGDGESSETGTVNVTSGTLQTGAETGIGSAVNESQSGPVWSPVGETPALQVSPVRLTARADATAVMRQYR